jgi:1-acyl-sn-glycerol-3-phosphate acyltransferase
MTIFGFIVLSVLAVAILATLVCWVRTQYSLVQSAMFLTCCLMTKLLWRTTVVNEIPIAKGQGALIAANHRSSVDPFFVQISSNRTVHWMVAHEYFKIPVIGYLLRQTGAIPTTRGGSDTKATRESIRFAQSGELVGVLPEGKINQTEDQFMLPVRPGAAMIAIRAGVPIVPCYIEGAPFNKKFWTPFVMTAKVRVTYGEPIPLPEIVDESSKRAVAEQLTLQVVAELARLAGRDDFTPTLRRGATNPAA